MKSLDSIMATPAEMPPETSRDNFLKINRLFKQEFLHEFGQIPTTWEHLENVPSTVQLYFSRIGRQITLQWEGIKTSLKRNATDPHLSAVLPEMLRPRATVIFTCWAVTSAGDEVMYGEVTTAGVVTLYSHNGWTAAGYAEIYGASVTYLGS